jgi:hypothetical protein
MRLPGIILSLFITANLFAQQNNIIPDTSISKQIHQAEQKLKEEKQKLSQVNILKKDGTRIDSLKSAEKHFSDSL